jgi:putative membrane protein
MRKLLRNFINGLSFGIVETVPGVSGGTVAVILGFYDELIDTINHFRQNFRKRLSFLIPLLLGTAAGIVAFGSLIHFLLTNYSFPTMSFFIGLIVGIIPLVFMKVKMPGKWFSPPEHLMVFIPVLVLVAISVITNGKASAAGPAEALGSVAYMVFIFFAGIIAAAALIIPGISGSFVLLLLGVYPTAVDALASVKDLFFGIETAATLADICRVLVPLAVGIVIGGLSMARLIGLLLEKHHKTVYLIILGLLIGSVYALFRNPIVYNSGVPGWAAVTGAATFILGGATSFSVGRKRL